MSWQGKRKLSDNLITGSLEITTTPVFKEYETTNCDWQSQIYN